MLLVALAATIATPALADSPFDGTWRVDTTAIKISAKPDVFSITNGTYRCQTCKPTAYAIPADGKFHAVAGRPYWDDLAVTVVDPKTVKYQFRKGGKVISENTSSLSADGNTLRYKSRNTNNGAGAAVDAESSMTRVGQAPKGAHAISGSWNPAPPTSVSNNALTMDMKLDGDTLTMKSELGETLVAKMGGPYALNAGDPGKTMTKVERVSATAFRLTDMSAGKVTQVSTYTLSPDGRSIAGNWRDPRDGSTGSWVARKQ